MVPNERDRRGRSSGEVTASGVLVGGAVEPVDSATVLVLRDGAAAASGRLEVLLLERHLDADFAGGALVFPGGKVDAADRQLSSDRWRGPDLTWWRERLGAADEVLALGLLSAAVRETFEEAGVLLAARADGSPVGDRDLRSESFVTARRRLAARGEHYDWRPWLEHEELVLDFCALGMWSWWVTPEGHHKRFDTRFLVARLPAGQAAEHDAVEMTSTRWTTPDDALLARERGESVVIFPTRRNLSALTAHETVDEVFAAVDADRVDRRRILPEIVRRQGTTLVQHPDGGDPEPI